MSKTIDGWEIVSNSLYQDNVFGYQIRISNQGTIFDLPFWEGFCPLFFLVEEFGKYNKIMKTVYFHNLLLELVWNFNISLFSLQQLQTFCCELRLRECFDEAEILQGFIEDVRRNKSKSKTQKLSTKNVKVDN